MSVGERGRPAVEDRLPIPCAALGKVLEVKVAGLFWLALFLCVTRIHRKASDFTPRCRRSHRKPTDVSDKGRAKRFVGFPGSGERRQCLIFLRTCTIETRMCTEANGLGTRRCNAATAMRAHGGIPWGSTVLKGFFYLAASGHSCHPRRGIIELPTSYRQQVTS